MDPGRREGPRQCADTRPFLRGVVASLVSKADFKRTAVGRGFHVNIRCQPNVFNDAILEPVRSEREIYPVVKILSDFKVGDIVVRYLHDEATGRVGLQLIPATMLEKIVSRRTTLRGLPF